MKRLFALALATLMVLSLVACGGGGGTTSGGTTSGATSGGATSGGTTTPVEPAVEYKKEIVLTGGGSVFEHPDPQYTASSQNTRYAFMSHDRLAELDPFTGELSPGLAKSWEVSADGLTYTFQLRDDVTFHNGEKFTADDVVYTAERGKTSPNANVVKSHSMTESIEAQGDYTVVMKLAAPNADFLLTRAYAYMSIVNREACEAAGPDSELGAAVGTGLWILKEFELNDYAVWERNDNYWGESTPTERITYRHIPEAAARAVAVETGEVDITTAITAKDAEAVAENKALEIVETPASSPNYFAFNLNAEGPWQDINFRRACAYAIDFDALILGVHDGNATQAKTFWGNIMFGRVDAKNAYSVNVEKAKEYLAKSSYKGEEIVCIALQSWTNQALVMSDMFSKIGIKMRVDTLASADLSAKTREGQWEALSYTYTFNPNGSDMTRFLTSKTGGAIWNPACIPNAAKIDQLLAEAAVSQDDAKRRANYAEVQELMLEDVVVIPTAYATNFNVQPKGTEGIVWNPSNEYDFKYVKVPVSK